MAETAEKPKDVVFNPFSLKDPTFSIVYYDGTQKEFEPFSAFGKLLALQGKSDTDLANGVRAVFGYPTDSDIAAVVAANAIEGATQQEVPKTPTYTQSISIMNALFEFYQGMEVIKKMLGLTQSLSALGSSPQN